MTIPFQYYVFPGDSSRARASFAHLPATLTFFSSTLGPYPFADEKYGVAEFTTQSFREHQTIPSLGSRLITGDRRLEWVLAHELAHQWFGNSASVRTWSDAWLNEGMATYAAMLWKEHDAGRAAYDDDIAAARKRTFGGTLRVSDSTDTDHMFGATTFYKGALFMHWLRETIGDAEFFAALRTYLADHSYGLTTTSDFKASMTKACGATLDPMFTSWLVDSGGPPGVASQAIPHCKQPSAR